jgi:hypothetical protein
MGILNDAECWSLESIYSWSHGEEEKLWARGGCGPEQWSGEKNEILQNDQTKIKL